MTDFENQLVEIFDPKTKTWALEDKELPASEQQPDGGKNDANR